MGVNGLFYLEAAIPYVKGLAVRGEGTLGYSLNHNKEWNSEYRYNDSSGNRGYSDKNTSKTSQWYLFLKYNQTFGIHAVDVVTGTEINRGTGWNMRVSGTNLMGEFQELSSIGKMNGDNRAYLNSENYSISFFNRVDYKLLDRYIIGATYIREGTSKFSKENRWGDFYSASLGWILSSESFMKDISWISLLKIRGSVGETGNQNIAADAIKTVYTSRTNNYYLGLPSKYLSSVGNTGVKWEKTQNIDLGIDFGFFNNRFSGSVAYYRQNVQDMLLKSALPISGGIANSNGDNGTPASNAIWGNIGDLYNHGIEVDLNGVLIQKKGFSWTANFNITTNKNKVTALSPEVDINGTGIIITESGSVYRTITRKGSSIGTYMLADWVGVDPEKGINMIYEIDQDIYSATGNTVKTGRIIPATDNNVSKNPYIHEGKTSLPTVYGGLNNTFRYKDFDLSMDIYFSLGNWIAYEPYSQFGTGDGRGQYYTETYTKSWKKPGDKAEYAEMRWGGYNYDDEGNPASNVSYSQFTSKQLVKGDYLHLRNLTVGYTFPQSYAQKMKLQNLRFYFSASNLLTITKYPGWDPELPSDNKGVRARAGNSFPQVISVSGGFNLSF